MKLQNRLFPSVLLLLLSPMSANAALFTYTGNPFESGHYLTAQVEITSTAPGLYSQSNNGLLSYTVEIYDSADNLFISLAAPPNDYDPLALGGYGRYDDFVYIDTAGAVAEWFLLPEAGAPDDAVWTINQYTASHGGGFNAWTQLDVFQVSGTPIGATYSPDPAGWVVSTSPIPDIDPSVTISDSANVDPTVSIGAYSVINNNVTVGANSTIGSNSTLNKNVNIGSNVQVGDMTTLNKDASVGFGSSIANNVVIAKNVWIGEDVSIGDATRIGKDSVICSGSQIGASVVIGGNVLIQTNAIVPDGDGVTVPNGTQAPTPAQCN